MINVSFSTMPELLGIHPLTGEACALSMRILCDLSEAGAELMRDYLGLPHDCPLSPAWNSTVSRKPAIACMMIERSAFPAIVHFALLRNGCQYVYGRDDSADSSGFSDSDFVHYPDLRDYVDGSNPARAGFDDGARLYRNPCTSAPIVGTRAVHAFSGRVE
jgi:hypothetical protein